MKWNARTILGLAAIFGGTALIAMTASHVVRLGRQPDGSFLVSTGQRIPPGTIAFRGRPSDLALSPDGRTVAVLNKNEVFLVRDGAVIEASRTKLGGDAGFHGVVWTPDGKRIIASTSAGHLQTFSVEGDTLTTGSKIIVKQAKENPVPGGMCVTRNGRTLFVPLANLGQIAEVDLASETVTRRIPVEMVPFEVRLTEDEKGLVVSNWGGRIPKPGERVMDSEDLKVLVTENDAPASGTVSLIDRTSGTARSVAVGIHPSAISIKDGKAYVANAMSDTISEIDLAKGAVTRTFALRYGRMRVIGAMPVALAVSGSKLYVCDGGDNALAEIDLRSGRVLGYRSAGYYPIAIALMGDTAVVLNSKGNGSVANTVNGKPGNSHDFQGTISLIDLKKDLRTETATVAANNRWDHIRGKPNLAVYRGAIKHVIYIIKENRTYDEIYGDMPEGNGDPKLCSLGEKVMPNHRKLAREFTLFDNGYVSGTNSADGHAWSDQAMANDYLEHFYVGYSRTYPDDGDDAMAISNGGTIWQAALRKKKTIRVYGEYADDDLATYKPRAPKDWFEAWEDRVSGANKFQYVATARFASLQPYLQQGYHYWPLIQSDQARADVFIKDFTDRVQNGTLPHLMVLSLPSDHSEGANPAYPTPRSMMADNDLALGRIVEAVTRSPAWKETAIFVIEDDAQAGPDHVDGHRTSFMVISPYNKRRTVDSNFYTTAHMLRSIEMMLGLDPMTRFDLLAGPIDTCFNETPDLTPYTHAPNNVPLGEPNPGRKTAMTSQQRYWAEKTMELDWSHIDAPDPYWLNRIIWASVHPNGEPYPARDGEEPGQYRDED